jgi:shikimate dehydrogenase
MPALTAKTHLVGLIGWPVEHSLSPAMHNAAFAALALDWAYVPLPVHPKRIREAVLGLRALSFAGANVTVPHKRTVIPYLSDIDSDARAVGAVNTIVVREDGRLCGHNTDIQGFLRGLEEVKFNPAGQRCVVLGAGGAARAVVYALASRGGRVVVLNRSVENAQSLVHALSPYLPPGILLASAPLTANDLSAHLDHARLLVNCTPAGMAPHTLRSPLPGRVDLHADMVVYDLVYNPVETLFLKQAGSAGAIPLSGLGMLVHQGAESLRLWTGQQPPLDVMRRACEEGLHA